MSRTQTLSIVAKIVFIATSLMLTASCATRSTPPPTTLPTSTPGVTPPPASPTPITSVLTHFIAGGDNGRSGKKIGCNDSLIPVAWDIPPTDDPIRAALEKQFSFKDQLVGPVSLYNALYQSDLRVEDVSLDENGHAVVHITGSYLLGGVCDEPRFTAQIEDTVLQFTFVSSADIYINDTLLKDLFSQQE